MILLVKYMKLKFENQDFQLQAVNSTVALFNGMTILDRSSQLANQNEILSFDVVANGLQIDNDKLLENLQSVQLSNNLENISSELYYGDYADIANFGLEMETGTGKTYVYLRTIFELNKLYGITKFIIVVPSDAIRTGTLKSLEITEEHFKSEFNNVSYNYYQYDSSKSGQVRDFATTNAIQIMVMTIAAFNKAENIIYHCKDKTGEYTPIELITAVRPVVIIDEPQSVDNTINAKNAIKELAPLFILRYSATHREIYNQVYKLDALDAYDRKLVKQIEVASIEDAPFASNGSKPYIKVIEITSKLELTLELDIQDLKGKKTRKIFKKIPKGTDLQLKTNNDAYTSCIVEDFSRDYGLKLANLDYEIAIGDSIGNEENIEQKTSIMLRLTIENHIKRELRLARQNIKVLSLFFINKVADYRQYAKDSKTDGWLAKLFIEQLKFVLDTSDGRKYIELCRNSFGIDLTNEDELNKIHDGYFAQDKKGVYKDSKEDTQDALAAYQLIMKEKEKLLDQKTPMRFIFSHSALKEGWDNPNVFQVCVLQDSNNIFKRRQQVGRGLRLCVNSEGMRVKDDKINTLTVIAGESYHSFATNLEREYEQDANIKFGNIYPLKFVNQLLQTDKGMDLEMARNISTSIHDELKTSHYIDSDNKITQKGLKALKAGLLELHQEYLKSYSPIVEAVLTKLCKKLPIENQRNKVEIKLNPRVYASTEFRDLWKKISHKTIYSVKLNTEELVSKVVTEINLKLDISILTAKVARVKMNIDASGIATELMHSDSIVIHNTEQLDLVTKLVLATGLTRKTVILILRKIDTVKLNMFKLNATTFIEETAKTINDTKTKLLVDGIKYQKISDLNLADGIVNTLGYYSQSLIEQDLDYGYSDSSDNSNIADAEALGVSSDQLASKFLFDVLRYDSKIEFDFLKNAISQDRVKLITKLPSWFKVNTPLGKYNPDWALLLNEEGKDNVYFIAETKGENFDSNGRALEKDKTRCGKIHFINALGIEYKTINNVDQVL